MAHLYNALKQTNHLLTPWPKMHKLIEAHTPEYMFFGGTPTNLSSCYTKLRLSMGLSAGKTARDARPAPISPRRRREFHTNVGPMTPLFHNISWATSLVLDSSKHLSKPTTRTPNPPSPTEDPRCPCCSSSKPSYPTSYRKYESTTGA